MKLHIQPEVISKFQPIIGVIYAHNLDNSKQIDEFEKLLGQVSSEVRNEFAQLEAPTKHPNITAWRKAYSSFGCDASKYRCSSEALVRRVLKGENPPRINTLVDLYNYISLKYVLPVGGENLAAIEGQLQLAFATGQEEFIRLNGTENEPPELGEVVYKDEKGVVCRRWNWREADRTKLTPETKNAIIVIDTIAPTTRQLVEQATNELAELMNRFTGGQIETEVMDT